MTKRENQVAALVAEGVTNKEIAFRLGLAEGTVKVYLSRIFERVGVGSRLELALHVRRAAIAVDLNDRLALHNDGFGVRNGAD